MRSVAMRMSACIAAVAMLAACGSSGGKAAKTTAGPKTVVETVTAAPTTDAVPTDATTDDDTAAAPTDAEVSGGAVPTVSGVVAPSRSGSNLTLDDFFQPDSDWSQELDSVANQSGVQGIKGGLNCGSTSQLELRLNDQFRTFAFSTAEDNTSDYSNVTMVVSVLVNGRQVTAKQVKFNAIQKFSVNVASANAVIVQFSESGDPCGGINPVLFNATVK